MREDQDRVKVFWIIILIIGLIMGVILTLIGPNIVNFVFFEHSNNFLVVTPFIANILVGIATILFCVASAFMITEKKVIKGVATVVLITSLVVLYSGFTNYTIFSTEDITVKTPFSKTVYDWGDLEAASKTNIIEDERTGVDAIEFKFTFSNGEIIEISVNPGGESWRLNRLESHISNNGVNLVEH